MSADYKVRGVEKKQERDASDIYRDSRRMGEKLSDWFGKPSNLAFVMLVCALLIVYMPSSAEIFGFTALMFWLVFAGRSKKLHLPMRMPFEYDGYDYNDPLPGRNFFKTNYRKARGIFYLGNEKETNQELHLSADDMLTHMLLFGTTGAGKTEALLSLSWNSISMGSGLIFIDPKGTNKLGLQVYSMARVCGREDDFLEINFSTGNRDVNEYSLKRLSNTANPFAYGTADSLAEILVSLIPTSEGENAVFSERAVSLIYTVMRPLVDLRNQKALQLSISTIRDHLTLEKCMELATDQRISDASRKSMEAYLNSVAGFKAGQPYEKQGEDAHKQFGFAQAYFTRALSSLVDTYGHVYGAMMGEVDYPDVVFNRRILVILLPAMEKPPSEIKTLGKIILSAIRGAMSLGLGSEFEGTKEEMLDSLPTASNVPNLVIADEYGYVATEGFAVTAAQARGLGFSCVFAGQDYAGFKRGSETEAEQILSNTKVKLIMALEDAQATLEVVKAIGGEAYVTNTSGYTMDGGGLSSSYRDIMNVSVERRQRVDIQDLRDQIEGEFHAFHKANMVRGQMFHADPPLKTATLRFNRFLEIRRPERSYLINKYGPVKDLTAELKELIRKGKPLTSTRPAPETPIVRARDLLRGMRASAPVPANDCALVALLTSMPGYTLPAERDAARQQEQEVVHSADSSNARCDAVIDTTQVATEQSQGSSSAITGWGDLVKSSSEAKPASGINHPVQPDQNDMKAAGAAGESTAASKVGDTPLKVTSSETSREGAHWSGQLIQDDSTATQSHQPDQTRQGVNVSLSAPPADESVSASVPPESEPTATKAPSAKVDDDVVSALGGAVPGFFNPNNIQLNPADDSSDDEEEDDDPNAELRALLADNIKSSLITDQVSERVKECAAAVSPDSNPDEAVDEIKTALSDSVTEYPVDPIPEPSPNTQFDIRNTLRDLRKKGSIKG
ncbi:TraM recognition domain-containing protein [Marinobacterium sp. BA1]|uniref:TraM recognition domain-containing protein n=1 Tax=Marinobacterium sp. BA1 TaxID=3138931 RepID=UPI0032E5E475